LAIVGVVVVVALLVFVALGEALVLLILLVGPPWHHVAEFHGSSRAVAFEVMVSVLQKKLFWKQRMTSSSVMLAMVARISKKRRV
jgi:hypothetical protein